MVQYHATGLFSRRAAPFSTSESTHPLEPSGGYKTFYVDVLYIHDVVGEVWLADICNQPTVIGQLSAAGGRGSLVVVTVQTVQWLVDS